MRMSKLVETCRILTGPLGSDPSYGANGAFEIIGPMGAALYVIASDGVDPVTEGWEHVSVSLSSKRCPNWPEMCFVKDLFWSDEETVIQFHPARSEYVNLHPTTLHLWRHRLNPIATPPSILVGPK
jgi:hypothetical protein